MVIAPGEVAPPASAPTQVTYQQVNLAQQRVDFYGNPTVSGEQLFIHQQGRPGVPGNYLPVGAPTWDQYRGSSSSGPGPHDLAPFGYTHEKGFGTVPLDPDRQYPTAVNISGCRPPLRSISRNSVVATTQKRRHGSIRRWVDNDTTDVYKEKLYAELRARGVHHTSWGKFQTGGHPRGNTKWHERIARTVYTKG